MVYNILINKRAVIDKDKIIVEGIPTHNELQRLLIDLREYIEDKERKLVITFKGSPGPNGTGLCIEIEIKGKQLTKLETSVIEKFFKIRNYNTITARG